MRQALLTLATGVVLLATIPSAARAHDDASEKKAMSGLKLETLLKTVLEDVEGTEIIVSRVTVPPNSSLPKHWHPGEEFAYILEGSAILWQKGKEDIVGKAGDVMAVPLKQVHTAMTTDEGAVILVFRVHEQGEPERVLVEDVGQ